MSMGGGGMGPRSISAAPARCWPNDLGHFRVGDLREVDIDFGCDVEVVGEDVQSDVRDDLSDLTVGIPGGANCRKTRITCLSFVVEEVFGKGECGRGLLAA